MSYRGRLHRLYRGGIDRDAQGGFSQSQRGAGFGRYNHRHERSSSGRGSGRSGQGQGPMFRDEGSGFQAGRNWREQEAPGYGGGNPNSNQTLSWQERPGLLGNYQDAGNADGAGKSNRPPPHLKGREIGLWYARRSQARKESEEKTNRSTVSMDKKKEQNIRQLLNTLQDGNTKNAPVVSETSSQIPQPTTSATAWGSGAKVNVPSSAWASSSHFPAGDDDGASPAASSSSHTTFVYQEESKDFLRRVPPDSWEMTSDSDDNVEITEIKSSSQEEDLVDLDQYDDEGKKNSATQKDMVGDEDGDELVPSVSGVVQYMMSHGEFPYGAETTQPDTDFIEEVPKSGNPIMDRMMGDHMLSLDKIPSYRKMLDFRKNLPSYQMREKIVSTINSNQVLVISGETGCGKTTQVPQFILDSYIERGIGSQCRIICTQPRRISAISVAERVAAERCEKVDDTGESSVGYQIRLETKRPRSQGSVLFCTTGIVLKFLEGDPDLHRATHIIIDEIHERDLQSDFLMIILKDLLPRRTDLKVILMSATLNAEMFSQYFDGCPMLNIPGYTYPVKEYLLEDVIEMTGYSPGGSRKPARRPSRRRKPEEIEEEEEYKVWCGNLMGRHSRKTMDILRDFNYSEIDIDLIHHIINYICTTMEDGAILVFVPGWEEIKKLHEMIQNTARCKSGSLRVIPLHSLMPTVNQRQVFDRPPPGVRKIVIATNIAETSITIDDVVFVIDCGKIKVKDFQPEMNLTSLEPQWVSKANAKQRRGRAGRVQPGHCFHLYTEFHYGRIRDYLPPEMLRTRLEELCLQIKLLKLGMIVPFIRKAMQHPSIEAIKHAVDTLIELQALDRQENLLPLGYHLARLPVEPHTGKMILFGAMFCCLDPILTVAASLSFKDAFTIPLGREAEADKARKRLGENSKSDHIMLINAFKGWETSMRFGNSQQYCWENFLSQNTLKMLKDMKRQLAELLYNIGFIASKDPKNEPSNINSGSSSMIRAVLCAGLYPNVAQVTKVPKPPNPSRPSKKPPSGVKMSVKGDNRVFAHPKSVNFSQTYFESKWVVFYHKLKTSKVYVHDSTMVSPYPLLFFGGEIQIIEEDRMELVSVDNWVKFKADRTTAHLVKDLRSELDKILSQKITQPGPTCWNKGAKEGALMAAIADLICTEASTSGRHDGDGQGRDGSIGRKEGRDGSLGRKKGNRWDQWN